MWFWDPILLQVLFITFLTLEQTAGSLVRRARSDGPGRPQVGPPNGAPQCDLKYGTPTQNDCDFAVDWISGIAAGNEENMELDEIAWDAYHRVYHAIVEFLNPQAERENRQRPAIRTPLFWRSGNCVISVTVLQGLGHGQLDVAAWSDIVSSGGEIGETCIDVPNNGRGGMQVIGEHNNLMVEVYEADSEHGDEQTVTYGEVYNHRDEPTEPTQPQYIDDSDEDMDEEDTVCFAGESAGWCVNASKCCSGYKFALQKLENVYQLLGIDAVSATSIGTCS
ncbi:MAG: hypothetical protein M1812_001625 [Candelaria pacifica]|nr:MAG: hypothetical protein M1812_001625 [Candelaria pacifica]